MNKNYFIILAVIIVIFSLKTYMTPLVREKEAVKVVEIVLESWKRGDVATPSSHWAAGKTSSIPPIDKLLSYSIDQKRVYKENKKWQAEITVTLELPEGSAFPSRNQWIFQLSKSGLGWQVQSFLMN